MSRELAKALLRRERAKSSRAKAFHFEPCVITQVSPLQITLNGVAGVDAETVSGCSYTVGQDAMALYTSPGVPVVLPIN